MKVVGIGNSFKSPWKLQSVIKPMLLVDGVDRVYLFSSKCVVESFKDYALCLS